MSIIEGNNITFWIVNDLMIFAVSIIITSLFIPRIISFAYRKRLFDGIDGRKIHKAVVPRLGGVAFFPSILLSITVTTAITLRFLNNEPALCSDFNMMPPIFEFCAIFLLYIIGVTDDLIGVSYKGKFLVQILSALLLMASGIFISNLHGFFWINKIPWWAGVPLTGFIIVYVINAINLIDGIDGLASGLSIIALFFYTTVFFFGHEFIYSMIAVATVGTLLSFFFFNIFGNVERRTKIFMGDTGAVTTGVILAFCSILISCQPLSNPLTNHNPLIVAFSPLIIPCFDVCRVYFHRVMHHRNPFLPDKCHIHHKLIALGCSQITTLSIILGTSLGFIALNMFLSPLCNPTLIFAIDIAIWTLANMGITLAIRKREKYLNITLYD